MTLNVGDTAPAFTLPIDGDGELSLSELKGKNVVLYFYPKDSTPGCTTEGQNFRDLFDQFTAANTVILGASKDSVKRHDNFKRKQGFPFNLLADLDGTLCDDYGVWQMKKNFGIEYMGIVRSTFLIGTDGTIKDIWAPVKVKGHADAVLEAVKAL